MSMFKKSSMKQRIIGYFLGIMVFVTILIIFVTITKARQKLLDVQRSKAEIVTSNLAVAASDPIMVGEWDRLSEILNQVKKSDIDVKYAILLGNDGKCVATSESGLRDKFLNKTDFEKSALEVKELTRRVNSSDKGVFEIVVPVNAAGQRMGTLRIGYSTASISAIVFNTIFVSLLIGFIALAAGSVVYYFMVQSGIVSPLILVMSSAQQIASGDLTVTEINVKNKDEIGELANTFTKMCAGLRNMVSQVRNTADKVATSSQEMSATTEEMNASSQEIASAIQKVTKGATTQAERISETVVITERTSTALKKMVANAQTASDGVNLTTKHSEEGRSAAQVTVEKISSLTETVVETAKVIQSLGEKSQQIGEITETITSIADQTNLLALNAAIEAARAGEAGRGFAVVAEEVRKLAEGSAEAVRKIAGLIRSIQTETNHAVISIEASSKEVREGKIQVEKIAEFLVEINKTAKAATILTNEIALAGKQQVLETEQVVKTINEVAAISSGSAATIQEVASSTEEQTASMEEMSASSQELARLATDLKDLVGKFKLVADERAA